MYYAGWRDNNFGAATFSEVPSEIRNDCNDCLQGLNLGHQHLIECRIITAYNVKRSGTQPTMMSPNLMFCQAFIIALKEYKNKNN